MQSLLQRQILFGPEITGDTRAMRARGEQGITRDTRVLVEECDRDVILIEDVGWEVGMTADDLTDKTRAGTRTLVIRLPVHGVALRWSFGVIERSHGSGH